MAAQLTSTKGPRARPPARWIVAATEPFAAARLAQNEDGRRATRGLGLTPEQPGELIADSPHP